MDDRLEEIRWRLADAQVDEELRAEGMDLYVEDLNGGIEARLIANGYEAAYFESLDEARDVARLLREDVPWLISRVEELETENRRLSRQIGKMLAGEEVEIMDVQISWAEE